MTIAVLTAVYGEYDTPWPLPPQDVPVESILVSDRPYDVKGWRNVVHPIAISADPRLQAKAPKMLPHLYTAAKHVIWLDAHLEVRSSSFVGEIVEHLGDGEWGAFRHPFIRSITYEAELAAHLPKYLGYDVRGQAQHYLNHGHPDNWGMWCGGLFIRRMTERVMTLGGEWLAAGIRWGTEDQIPLPVLLRKYGITPVDLPFEGWWAGRRFMLHTHSDGTG